MPQFLIFGLSISYYIATCGYDYFPGLSAYFDSDPMTHILVSFYVKLTSGDGSYFFFSSFGSGDGKMLVNRFSLFAKVQI